MEFVINTSVSIGFVIREDGPVVLRFTGVKDDYPGRPSDQYVVEMPATVIPAVTE
jgi:hypothetical protein